MSYTFNPQLHINRIFCVSSCNQYNSSIFYLMKWVKDRTYESDELGFRNPKNQKNIDCDFIFIFF